MVYQAHIRFRDDGIIYRTLKVEAGREIPRTRVTVKKDGDISEVSIFADDAHALRAALNSYLRWIGLAQDIMEVMKNGRT